MAMKANTFICNCLELTSSIDSVISFEFILMTVKKKKHPDCDLASFIHYKGMSHLAMMKAKPA